MATKKALTPPITKPKVTPTPEKGTSKLELGTPIPIDRSQMPASGRRGRSSNEPEMQKWLGLLTPGQTYQMGGGDADGAHTVQRITQLRKVASKEGNFTVETSPVESGKRYLVFVTANEPEANGDAGANTPANAPAGSTTA